MDIRNAVVLGQPFVHECVIRVEQVHDTSIPADDAFEEHLGFVLESLAQIIVEVLCRSFHLREFPQAEPLPREVGNQSLGLRIREHAPRLLIEYLGIAELTLRGDIQEFVVGNAAPQEKRQPRSQLDIAQPVNPTVR